MLSLIHMELCVFFQQCCDLGYHASLNRALRTFLSAELNLEQSKHEGLDAIENAVENLDANSDKQRLMEMYNNVFCPPMKFEFQPHMGDMVSLWSSGSSSVNTCSFPSALPSSLIDGPAKRPPVGLYFWELEGILRKESW